MKSFSYYAADCKSRDAQQKPQPGKRQTNLTVQVAGHIAVIPDVPAQIQVIQNAYGEFNCRDDQCAAQTLEQERVGRCFQMELIQDDAHGAAGKHHRPMGIASGQDFQQTVKKQPSRNIHHSAQPL